MARRLKPGNQAPKFALPAIDGSTFELASMRGKPFMLSFFRFASCPFCNLRLHELVQHFDELGKEFGIVAIFDSPLENLQRHAEGHHAPFAILADAENISYRAYAIEHSIGGVIKGMLTRMPTLIRGMAKGYVPTTIQGNLTTIPADFLIDAQGIIRLAYYGSDEGDHLPFAQIKAFARSLSETSSPIKQ